MRNIRRRDREIGIEEAMQLLSSSEYGVLSTVGKDGQPYGVPLSYVCKDYCIYFHCALDGHKIDNIAGEPRVSFCVVGNTSVLPGKFATEYESAVAFGVASEIFGVERYDALLLLLEKYSPDFIEEGRKYIEQKDQVTRVFKLDIGQVSGKARR